MSKFRPAFSGYGTLAFLFLVFYLFRSQVRCSHDDSTVQAPATKVAKKAFRTRARARARRVEPSPTCPHLLPRRRIGRAMFGV
ncbi:hypothetical protein B0F90DRAFT_1716862 [Multifurca ochricompacta]|uniref:Uncharacterized protein n=1 Tax=Multifurca ochricompacta TaxID=376703 RepID=A0AAD4M540_9AGAM|nr:hypothetical protein B0F90DRAFT_1716862 [Multifurca ochricompacta]